MRRIILNRLIWAIPILIGMSILSFVLMKLSPGGVFEQMKMDPLTSKELIKQYEHKYGFDKPMLKQYLLWAGNFLKGDLGYSFYFKAPVKDVLKSRIKNTVILSVISMLIIWALALPLGVIGAIKKTSILEKGLSFLSFVGMCLPGFFLAFLLLSLASKTGLLPTGSAHSIFYNQLPFWLKPIDLLRHLAIPAFVIALPSASALYRIIQSNVRKAYNMPFSKNAISRGLPEDIVSIDYALRNSIHPLIVIFGYQIADILSGAALVEIICNWPGLGTIMLSAVQAQDMHLVMSIMMISGIMLIFGNLISDILLYVSDPRIREAVI